jgi:hypothetical protein
MVFPISAAGLGAIIGSRLQVAPRQQVLRLINTVLVPRANGPITKPPPDAREALAAAAVTASRLRRQLTKAGYDGLILPILDDEIAIAVENLDVPAIWRHDPVRCRVLVDLSAIYHLAFPQDPQRASDNSKRSLWCQDAAAIMTLLEGQEINSRQVKDWWIRVRRGRGLLRVVRRTYSEILGSGSSSLL